MFLLSFIKISTSIYYIIAVELLLGLTAIVIGASTGALSYVDIAKEKTSKATAIDFTFRQFAASFGIGLTAFWLTTFTKVFRLPMFSDEATVFHFTFYTLAILALIALFNGSKLSKNDGIHALAKF